jgi:hypothetical protein
MDNTQEQILIDIQNEIRQQEDKVQELRNKLSREEDFLKRLKGLGRPKQPLLPMKENVPVSQSDAQEGTVIEHIVTILSDSGGSMHVKDITEKLAAKGVVSGAQGGLSATVANALFRRRNDLFQRVRRGLYRLRTQT